MEYKSYNCNSYNIHTIKTDKFKTVRMEIIFSRNANKDEMPRFTFLSDLLTDQSKKYKSRKEISIELEELYKADFYGVTSKVGNFFTTNFIMEFISPEYINEDNYLERVLSFPFDVICNPNAKNKEFDITNFNIVKRRLKEEIESIKENSNKLAISDALTTMDSASPSSFRVLGTLDDLDKMTPSNLYESYLDLLNHSNCDIFIIGNINMDDAVKIIKNSFKNRVIKLNKPKLYVDNKLKRKVLESTNEKDFIQSNLVMIYNIKSLNDYENNIAFYVLNYILGGGLTSILYDNLRNKNSLCYSVKSMYLKQDSLLIINTLLDKNNIDKAKKLIKKSINDIKNGKFSEEMLINTKKMLKTSLSNGLDNNMVILNNYEFEIFDNLPRIEERIELIDKVTKEDVINCIKKVQLNTIYFQVGVQNERD